MFKCDKYMSAPEWYDLEDKAIKLLSDEKEFYNAGLRLLSEWKISCDENLSNTSQNRIAFIGQACCCLIYKVPEIITKSAWKRIDLQTQLKANAIAQKIINIYERQNNKIHKGLGDPMLF
jgi:hypothetical protein